MKLELQKTINKLSLTIRPMLNGLPKKFKELSKSLQLSLICVLMIIFVTPILLKVLAVVVGLLAILLVLGKE